MTCWEFFNLHFTELYIFLIVFFVVIIVFLNRILSRAKIGMDKNGRILYTFSPSSKENPDAFIKEMILAYQTDAFNQSYFIESKNNLISILTLQKESLEKYFAENDLNDERVKQRYNTDGRFQLEYKTKQSELDNVTMKLETVRNREWHGEFCGDFKELIANTK